MNLNTASSHLLTYISGLGPQLAQNIVNYRAENGAFNSRKELMKVPRMGAKAFEQCAGFLRIPGAKNPLDNTAVHPESYHIVEQMAKDLKCTVNELIADKELRRKINISNYVTPVVGLPTLQDIMQELEKPGRDPRKTIKVFEFDKNVRTIADLREGMILPGHCRKHHQFRSFRRYRYQGERSCTPLPIGGTLHFRSYGNRFHPPARHGQSDERRYRPQTDSA